MLDWPACSPDHLVNQEMQNAKKKIRDCWAATILYQKWMGWRSSLRGPTAGLLRSQMFTDCCQRKKGCWTLPCPSFVRHEIHCHEIQDEPIFFMSDFQYLICFLCSIVNKILFLLDLLMIAFCFYEHFIQHPNSFWHIWLIHAEFGSILLK